MINELDIVILEVDLPELKLATGDMGTVVHVYEKHVAFEVEFIATDDSTIAVTTLLPKQIRLASTKKEIFRVRKVA